MPALDLQAGVEQPFDCLVIQNRQAMCSMGGQWIGQWRTTWSMVCSSTQQSQAADGAIPHLCKQEWKCPTLVQRQLTPWRPLGFSDFWKKNSSFRLPYQRPSSSADCARELFNGLASLVDYTRKKFFWLGVWVFCEWHHKWRTFKPPWPTLSGPGRQLLGGSISLKFLLETRLQSDSFDTLDDLLGFRVQKLWCKLVKILCNLIIN